VIHPSAVIHPKARIDATVEIAPGVVIDEGVEVGPHCVLGPYVYITGITSIGSHNRFFAGCVVGEAPQDLKYKNDPTRLRIGEHNVFREHVTIHRSTKIEEETIIGSQNFFMQHSHVAHNVVVGNHAIIAGGALLAGHAQVADRAFVSGNCLVHQFTRVGTLSMMQGGSAISKDLPPYTIARGHNGICGLNMVGLRRAGIEASERLELKQLYHALFRNGSNLRTALSEAQKNFRSTPAKVMLDFIASARRGVCSDTGALADEEDEGDQ
jgi:UDP-N-acetylglucosamine acyltransferase